LVLGPSKVRLHSEPSEREARTTCERPLEKNFVTQAKTQLPTLALGNVIKGIAANQGSIKSIEKHNELVKNALKRFSNIEQLLKTEQILATGVSKNLKPVQNVDPAELLSPILLNRSLPENEKLRVILLYILHIGGISEQEFDVLRHFGQLSVNGIEIIRKFRGLGLDLVGKGARKESEVLGKLERFGVSGGNFQISLNLHEESNMKNAKVEMSRWLPAVHTVVQFVSRINRKKLAIHFNNFEYPQVLASLVFHKRIRFNSLKLLSYKN